jgi:hypothetical protein
VYVQALYNKEVEEVENPENPRGPTLYRYTMYTESEGTTHRKTIQQNKDKVMDTMELDFSFDDVDLGWQFKASSNALADIAAGRQAVPKRLESSGSQASGSQDPLPQSKGKDPLAIEDAKEKDKLLIKAEEAVRGNGGLVFKAKKIIKTLPPSTLGKKHCQHLEELKAAVENFTAKLESITINGTLPDEDKPVPMATLKELLKDSFAYSKDLSQACIMAQPLMPKKPQQVKED